MCVCVCVRALCNWLVVKFVYNFKIYVAGTQRLHTKGVLNLKTYFLTSSEGKCNKRRSISMCSNIGPQRQESDGVLNLEYRYLYFVPS
jgi:hypothetical protein